MKQLKNHKKINKEEGFDVFIDYQNGTLDFFVALKLFNILKRFKIPSQLRKKTLYKGEVYLPDRVNATADPISEEDKQALCHSRFLIIICSQATKASVRTSKIISLFPLKQNILTLLIQGEPEESFPKLLYEIEYENMNNQLLFHTGNAMENVEPLAADIRNPRITEMLKKLEQNEKYRLMAQILNCRYDDFINRHKHMKKQRRLAIGLIGIVLIYMFTMLGSAQLLQKQDKVTIEADQDISYYINELLTDHKFADRESMISSHLKTITEANRKFRDANRNISSEAVMAFENLEQE